MLFYGDHSAVANGFGCEQVQLVESQIYEIQYNY